MFSTSTARLSGVSPLESTACVYTIDLGLYHVDFTLQKLPSLLSSDDEREILALMCRVHELEADKMALQSERLIRQHELRRRDLAILRYDRQRQLSEEIITRQRQLLEEGKFKLPPDLQELYQMYQQEIHASTYADYNASPIVSPDKLPPISKM